MLSDIFPFPFIGRQDALDAFHSLLSIRAQKNALYVEAGGGLGKTRLLREYIKACGDRPRWHVCPPGRDVDPLIDFYELSNRSIAGLRGSIVECLGEEYFGEFRACEAELHAVESDLDGATPDRKDTLASTIIALRRRIEDLFFKNFRQSLPGRQVVLFFDTFEVVHRRRVGRWFLEEFLPRSQGCLIVFAGRRRRLVLPPNVKDFELKPWTEKETAEYFEARDWGVSEREVRDLWERTKGHPLLVDMTIYIRNAGIADVNELASIPQEKMEWALIDRLVRNQRPEHQAIQEMAYLKRRFDEGIFELRQQGDYPAYEGISGYDDLVECLLGSELHSIVKYRRKGRILTLHDEAQRMIRQHAYCRAWDLSGPRPEWEQLREELYEQIVQGWYRDEIEQVESDDERDLLRAEQLGYELEWSVEQGLQLYDQYFEEVKRYHLFDFNELVWSEIADKLEDEKYGGQFAGQEYELCYAQADWLWMAHQFDAAADLYRLIVEKYTPDPDDALRRLQALAALGHALLLLGKHEQASDIFEDGLALAEQVGNRIWLSSFQQNKGQVSQSVYLWAEAEEWYKLSVETAQLVRGKETLALASVHLGHLQALLGRYQEAILNCERAVALRREILVLPKQEQSALEEEQDPSYKPVMTQPEGYFSERGRQTRVGIAYLRLSQVYRYSGPANRQKAKRNAEKALEYLKAAKSYRFWSEALQELGNISKDKGVAAREADSGARAVALQAEAFEHLEGAVTLCRQYGLQQQLPKALHRLAHVVFETGQLEDMGTLQESRRLKRLLGKVSRFRLSEEGPWLEEVERLREPGTFADLDTLGKAQRLFEVSSLEAERLGDANTSLDSLVQACEIALYRKRLEDVRAYAELARVPSQAHHQELFLALIELVLADLDLDDWRPEDARVRYSENIPVVARSGGWGHYLLEDRFALLGRRLLAMPYGRAIRWCDSLINEWAQEGLDASHPELIAHMWEYRNRIMEKKIDGVYDRLYQ